MAAHPSAALDLGSPRSSASSSSGAGGIPPPTPPPKGDRRIMVSTDDLGEGTAHLLPSAQQHQTGRRRRIATAALLASAGAAVCWAVAGLVASSDEADAQEPAAASDGRRRLGDGDSSGEAACHTALPGEPCHRHVKWAMTEGMKPNRMNEYPGLTADSSFEEFQAFLHEDPRTSCPKPCDLPELATASAAQSLLDKAKPDNAFDVQDPVVSASGSLGWESSGIVVSQGQWCSGDEPYPGWRLNGCGKGAGIQFKVLTYNLFWWNLFGRRKGDGGSAGRLIAGAANPQPFDVMGFQECEGIDWVLRDAGLTDEFVGVTGPHALCIAYRKSAWAPVSNNFKDVAEDRADQWYGTRAAMWVRLRHIETDQIVFFVNHHGPLPVNSGGRCGGEATAYNVLKLIGTEAGLGDVVVLVGDFNADPSSQTVQSVRSRMNPVFTGASFGGVDHVLSSCAAVAGTRNLGSGGSDHDALEVVLQL